LWNGNVLLCERVPDREGYVLGNVRTHSWEEMFAKREKVAAMSPSPCEFCSAAYLLTGLAGEMRLRHPESEREDVPIYVHSDHSQTFYSLVKAWSGINWSLGARP
jgi:sulfatase maturation enzyme AslB (radical SAM superfamily)